MIKYHPVSRRHFLMGLGGFSLAIPLLPSILTKQAMAEATLSRALKPRFITVEFGVNGGLRYSNWFPSDASLIKHNTPLYSTLQSGLGTHPEHFIYSGEIEVTQGKISPLFDEKWIPLKDQMNFYRGLDVMFSMVHHSAILGNFNATNTRIPLKSLPSIDQVIGTLRDKTEVIEPVMAVGPWPGTSRLSYQVMRSVTNPSSTPTAPAKSPLNLYNTLFNRTLTPVASQKEFVADRVLDSLNEILRSAFGIGSKLGSEDKTRLDEHVAMLHDIQQRLITARTLACETPPSSPGVLPSVGADRAQIASRLRLLNDIIIAAFKCDASRIATIQTMAGCEGTSLSNFHDISHMCHAIDAHQALAVDAKKYVIDQVIYDLVNKLNSNTDSDGSPLLDRSLVLVTEESSMVSHGNVSQPCVTFGSAGGFFNTGNYFDFRNRDSSFFHKGNLNPNTAQWPGIPWNRFLATVLQSMGIAPNQFERVVDGQVIKGYGDPYIELGSSEVGSTIKNRSLLYAHQLKDMSSILPLVKKLGSFFIDDDLKNQINVDRDTQAHYVYLKTK